MPNIFSIIGNAWDFYRKQPVLNAVIFWLYALPMAVMLSLGQLEEHYPQFSRAALVQGEGVTDGDIRAVALILLAELTLSIIMLWGTACVLLISKKLVHNPAGRTRSSFRTVRKEAGNAVANLFITGILRSCFTFLWALLLVLPGIVYSIRTFFFHVAIVCEGKEYREALQTSRNVVMGQTWKTLGFLLGIAAIIYIPIVTMTGAMTAGMYAFDERLLLPLHILSGTVWGFGTAIFTIASVVLYSNLKTASATLPPAQSWLS